MKTSAIVTSEPHATTTGNPGLANENTTSSTIKISGQAQRNYKNYLRGAGAVGVAVGAAAIAGVFVAVAFCLSHKEESRTTTITPLTKKRDEEALRSTKKHQEQEIMTQEEEKSTKKHQEALNEMLRIRLALRTRDDDGNLNLPQESFEGPLGGLSGYERFFGSPDDDARSRTREDTVIAGGNLVSEQSSEANYLVAGMETWIIILGVGVL